MATEAKLHRGFAAMSLEKRVEIARKGGKSVSAEKRAFSLDQDLARRAGRKGGSSLHAKRRGE